MPLPPPPAYLDTDSPPAMETEGPKVPALALRGLTGGNIEIICDHELPGFERKERRAGVVWTAAEVTVIPLQARRRWAWEEAGAARWCPHHDRAPAGARGQVQCLVMLVRGPERPLALLTGHGGRGALLWSKLSELAAQLKKETGARVALSSVALKVWGSEAQSPFAESVIPAWDWSVRGWATEADVQLARSHRPMVDAWREAWARR